jgi:sterol desaturase/sphingolipid hydroxylase (fatty acid hydroxylase superfamily)
MLGFLLDGTARVAGFLLLTAVALGPLEWAHAPDAATWWRAWRARGPAAGALLLVNSLAGGALGVWLVSRAPVIFRSHAETSLARLLLLLLLTELGAYWLHRAMHASSWLWRFHRLHHDSEALVWWDAWRQHPIEVLLHIALAMSLAWIVRVPISAQAPLVVARMLYASVLHAAVAPTPSRATFAKIVATPAFHHRHHHPGSKVGNYATLLACLDLVFGTWVDGVPKPERTSEMMTAARRR